MIRDGIIVLNKREVPEADSYPKEIITDPDGLTCCGSGTLFRRSNEIHIYTRATQ
jgi:hypothetical protein